MLEAALALARRGWHVFPVHWPIVTREGVPSCSCDNEECRMGGRRARYMAKHPVVLNGQNAATTDEGQIRSWWAAYPLANIGVKLEDSGLMALDVDDTLTNTRDGAIAKLQAAIDATGPLPETVQAVSGSGWHVYYRRPRDVQFAAEYMGITVRGNNYTIAPPSLHRLASRYTWEPGSSPDDVEVADLPAAWVAALTRRHAAVSNAGAPDVSEEPPWLVDVPDEERARRMREYVEGEEGEVQGQSRQSLLFIVAAAAVRGYAVRDADAALDALLAYGRRCTPPYSDEAIREKVWNAYAQAHTPEWGSLLQLDQLQDGLNSAAADYMVRWREIEAERERQRQARQDESVQGNRERQSTFREQMRRQAEIAAEEDDEEPVEDDADAVENAAVQIVGEPEDKPFSWAITYVMQRLTRDGTPTIRRHQRCWYQWTPADGHYGEVDDEVVNTTIQREGIEKPKHVEAIVKSMRSVPGVMLKNTVKYGDWVDGRQRDAYAAADTAVTRTALVNLATGEVTPPTPRLFAITTLGVDYDPAAPAPTRWLQFLDQLWRDDPESVRLLQEWFGYMLTPDNRQQKILMLVGPMRSGKGTIANILTALLGGDEAVVNPTLDALGERFGTMPLIGKMAAIIGDAKIDGKSRVAQVTSQLLSISGRDQQTIDRKNTKPWTGYLTTRFMILCNSLPKFIDEGGALAERMLVLQTTVSHLGREDHGLEDALKAELPGILNWAIEGWRRLRAQRHFTEPASSVAAKQELSDLAAPVKAWGREALVPCEREQSVPADLAYKAYKAWAREHGMPEVSSTLFGRDLKASFQCKLEKLQHGSRRVGCYVGVRLVQEDAGQPRPTVPGPN